MRKITLIFGKTGSGKTTLAKSLIAGLPNKIVVDQLNEYNGLIMHTVDDVIDKYERTGTFDVVFRPVDDTEMQLIFSLYKLGNITFVIEEIDMIATAFKSPVDFDYIVKYGRHYNISVIGICRRTQETSRLLTSQASEIYVSRMQENSDVAYFRRLGFSESVLRELPEHEFTSLTF